MSGDRLRYRSIAGDVYNADIPRGVAVSIKGPFGTLVPQCVPLQVVVPGCNDPVELRAVPFVGADNGARGVCFNREDHDGKASRKA